MGAMTEQQKRPGLPEESAPTTGLVAAALEDVARAAEVLQTRWALIGGQALVAHGIPRRTDDVDLLVPLADIRIFAAVLCALSRWVPLEYRRWERDFVPAKAPTLHRFDDLVLWDLPFDRVMYSLRSPAGEIVQLLAAQHPVEREMLAAAAPGPCFGAAVPLAPLGGVLVVKAIAGRDKDIAALREVAKGLPPATLDEAVAWARTRVPSAAERLAQVIAQARW